MFINQDSADILDIRILDRIGSEQFVTWYLDCGLVDRLPEVPLADHEQVGLDGVHHGLDLIDLVLQVRVRGVPGCQNHSLARLASIAVGDVSRTV